MPSEEMVSLDWVKKGWGDKLSPEFDSSIPFWMDFSDAQENDILPFDAAVQAALKIAENYPAPYTLMCSGGVDSQSMLLAWIASGVAFKVISVRYTNYDGEVLNIDDLGTLNALADKHGVEVETKYLNVIEFIENELTGYVVEYQCTSPQICTHMKISELVTEGTTVFSGNFYDKGSSLNFTILGLYRYALKKNPNLIPFFFIHDPILVGSFQKFCGGQSRSAINSTYAQKCNIYQLAGFDIIPQNAKMTGFEKVKEHYDERYDLVRVKDRLQFAKHASRRIFDLRFRYYFTKTVKYVDQIINIPPKRIK